MYILATEGNSLRKNAIGMGCVSVGAFFFDKIYAVFAHGVRSASMTYLFLYPLLGGVLVYLLLALFCPEIVERRQYRLFVNLYNSGIAALSVGSLLRGIFEIAGTTSQWVAVYMAAGWGMILSDLILLIWKSAKKQLKHTQSY